MHFGSKPTFCKVLDLYIKRAKRFGFSKSSIKRTHGQHPPFLWYFGFRHFRWKTINKNVFSTAPDVALLNYHNAKHRISTLCASELAQALQDSTKRNMFPTIDILPKLFHPCVRLFCSCSIQSLVKRKRPRIVCLFCSHNANSSWN